jgi:hypothetical protein
MGRVLALVVVVVVLALVVVVVVLARLVLELFLVLEAAFVFPLKILVV